MTRYRSWGRWLPAVVAAFILGWVALSLVAWPRATGDVTHDGFDPNLLWTGVLGTPTAGQVSLSRSSLRLTAGPGSEPTVHLLATSLRFAAVFDVRIEADGGSSDPLEIHLWSARQATGYLLRFGAAPDHTLSGQLQLNGAWKAINNLGTYDPHGRYQVRIALDPTHGPQTIDVIPTGSVGGTPIHSLVSAADAPGLFLGLPVAMTVQSLSKDGIARAVIDHYRLSLPVQPGLPRSAPGSAPVTVTLLVVSALLLGLVAAGRFARHRPRPLPASTGRVSSKMPARTGLMLLVAAATIGYLAGNLWLFHLGAHSYDIMAEKTFAYVAATYGPADLYDVPATVTPAKVWAGTPYAEVGFPYGPVMGIVFTAIGAVYRAAFGQGGIPPMDSIQLEVLIKLFNVVLGLVDGVLIYLILRKRLGNVLSAIGAGLFVFNPAVWFMMSVWGETQTISLLFLLLAIWRGEAEDPVGAWAALALAALTRPQMIIPAAFLALYLLRRFPLGASIRAASWSILIAFIAVAPFTLRISPALPVSYLERVAGTQAATPSDSYSYVSSDGYNLWPLVTQSVSGQSGKARLYYPASRSVWGPFSYSSLGTLLLVITLAMLGLTLALASRRLRPGGVLPFLLAATLALLVLKTGVSTHHFVLAIGLLIPCLGFITPPAYAAMVIAVTVTTFVSLWGSLGYALQAAPKLYPLLDAEHNTLTAAFMNLFNSDVFITAATIANLAVFLVSLALAARALTREGETGRPGAGQSARRG